jgi:sugar lactone lactonase YvrE
LRIGPDGALWIVDAGAPGIGKPAVRGAARIFRVDLHSNRISRIYDLRPVVRDTSYVDDIRFNGGVAYLTDAGAPALIVLDLASGHARRVLEDQPSTTDQRPLHADGKVLTDAQGKQVRLHADQLEVSPNGQYLYYQPASGPMSRIATQYLGDRSLSLADLNRQVEGWVDTPTTGGTAIDAQGNIYLSDTNLRRILRITPAREMSVLVADPRLIWPDAMWIDHQGFLWMPAAQLNLTPDFNGGKMSVQYPVWIYKMQIGVGPPAIDHA